MTRGNCRRGEEDASFKAPYNDADDESSGANKAQAVGEATEAKCDVRVDDRRRRNGAGDLYSCESGDVLGGRLAAYERQKRKTERDFSENMEAYDIFRY